MPRSRRHFIAALTGGAVAARATTTAEAQAPPKVAMNETEEPRRRLAAEMKALNDAAGLGVTADEIERAQAYATGALLAARDRLRTIELDPSLDLAVSFSAKRS